MARTFIHTIDRDTLSAVVRPRAGALLPSGGED
jgi:hypothetical protein